MQRIVGYYSFFFWPGLNILIDVTSDFDNIVENAKDCGILFILLLARA